MGRPERPLDPAAGPVAEFAARLRELRREAGTPSYRTLSQRARYAPSMLSSAASGFALPSLQVTLAFVRACGGDPQTWTQSWHAVAAAVRRGGPTPPTRDLGRLAAPPALAQLPPHVSPLVGRSAQIAAVERHLATRTATEVAPVVVHGPLGAGKTAFATYVAQRLRAGWPDGQLFANLSGSTDRPNDPGEVLGWFIGALGVPADLIPPGLEQRTALYRSLLADRRVLVLLDDARDEPQVRPLLAPTPGSLVLITSRSRLAGLPAALRIRAGALSPDDSVAMLGAMVGPDRIDADRAAAHVIAELCDHLALALWIVGARLAVRPDLTLIRAVEQIRQTPDWLRVGDVSVRSRLATAYRPLSRPARGLLRLLAAEQPQTNGASSGDRPAALRQHADDLVEELTEHGLLDPRPDGPRLPALFGSFVRERVGSTSDRAARHRGARPAHPYGVG